MLLNTLKSPQGGRKRKKIVGRGPGSGHGKTSCRGENGQKSRAGRGIIGSLEGGQVPLIRRLPKVGFHSRNPRMNQIVNLSQLTKFKGGTIVNAEFLKSQGFIKSIRKPIKILGDGDIKKSLTFQVDNISKLAQDKIVQAGGEIEPVKKVVANTEESVASE